MRKGMIGVRGKTGPKNLFTELADRNRIQELVKNRKTKPLAASCKEDFAEGFASVPNVTRPPPLSIKYRHAGHDIPLVVSQEEVHEVNDVEEVEDLELDDDYPALKTRTSPKILVEALKKLNHDQEEAVKEIGFGSILKLEITALPHKLCYWVLDNFDPRSSELNLLKGRSIHVTPEDVHVTLGLPMGETSITKEEKHEKSSMRTHWESFFGKTKDRILPSDVAQKMLAEIDGDLWFKRHFLVLLTSCLIETSSVGYVLPQIMDHLSDIDNVANLNWCEYILKRLMSFKMDWESGKASFFRGPILFLTVMYCDHVMLFERVVPRAFPSIIGWDKVKLRRRKTVYSGKKKIGQEVSTPPKPPKKKSKITPGENNMQAFTDRLLGKVKVMAHTMSDIMEMVQEIPEGFRSDLNFVRILSATQQPLGCTEEVVEPSKPTQENDWPEELGSDEFWAERMSIIENIEKCYKRKMVYAAGRSDCLSYSLGLTQDEIDKQQPNDTARVFNTPSYDSTNCGSFVDPRSSSISEKVHYKNESTQKDPSSS